MTAFQTVLLRNARIVLPDRITDATDVFIEGDRIARILASSSAQPKSDSVVDLSGLTIFPGFIDIHIHGSAGVDTMEASPQDLLEVAQFLATQGVTAWLPTLVPAPVAQYQQAIRAIEQAMVQTSTEARGSLPGARVLGVHYEGPFVNSEQCGALHREYFRTFSGLQELNELPVVKSPGALHLMTLAPEVAGGIDLITELNRRGWIVSIGHTRADAEVLDRALSAGARHMTHFMNAMTALHHRKVGVAGWGLIHDEVTVDLIADGIHIDGSILRLIVRNKTTANVSLISDAIAATGKGDGEYKIWGETIAVKNGRTRNAAGSIAGSVITMLDAVRTMHSLGFSECETARMASMNPARLLGIENECGSIAEGKRADLVALDENLNARATIVAGRIKHY